MQTKSRLYTEEEIFSRAYWGIRTRYFDTTSHLKPDYMRYKLTSEFKTDIFNVFWFRIKFREIGLRTTLRDALELCNTTLVRKGFNFKDYVEKKHSHRNIKPCKNHV